MRIEIDGEPIFEIFERTKQSAVREYHGRPTGSFSSEDEVDNPNYGVGVGLQPVRAPLPFGSVGGGIKNLNGRYFAAINLGSPHTGDINPDMRVVTRSFPFARTFERISKGRKIREILNAVEECHQYLPEALANIFSERYVRVGKTIDGYLLDAKGQNSMAISRDQESGDILMRMGGSGLTTRIFPDKRPNFDAELGLLAEDATKVLNAGINRAIELGLTKSNPDITLRLSS